MRCDADCWNTIGVRGKATCEHLPEVAHCRNCPEYVAAGRLLLDRSVPGSSPEEWARLIAEPRQARRLSTISVVIFRIGAEWLALKTVVFERAVTSRAVHLVPSRTNRVFRGIVNVGGELLLCVSAGEALGMIQDTTDIPNGKARERLLVVSREGQRWAFHVDEVLGVRSLATEDLAPAPATLSNAPDAVTASVFSVDARRVGLLDEVRFFERMTKALAS